MRERETTCGWVPVPDLLRAGYGVHDCAMTLPDSTFSEGMLVAEAVEAVAPAPAALVLSSSVPVSSSFLPTCGLSDVGFATSIYVWPAAAFGESGVAVG